MHVALVHELHETYLLNSWLLIRPRIHDPISLSSPGFSFHALVDEELTAMEESLFSSKNVQQTLKKLRAVPPTKYEQKYLLGFRGLLIIETFLWAFLQTFVPVTVVDSDDTNGRLYQRVIRKTLSVVFWNEYLLYGSFIFLSARSIAIPFLRDPSRTRLARTFLCRGITLWFPVAVSLAIVKLAFSQTGLNYIYQFKVNTSNISMQVPYNIPNTFAYFNSVFDLFWTAHNWDTQAGSTAFPTQTLWMINAIYMQSYTVYITMIIIPYTRNKWRVQGAIFFILTAWWCQSWAWYTITGLIIADMVINMDFKAKAQRGIPLHIAGYQLSRADGSPRCLPTWIPAILLMIGGFLMQYLWAAWRPDMSDDENLIHSGLYYTGGLNVDYASKPTQARDDVYLILLGFFILLETSDILQRIFSVKFLTYLGRRSLSM